MKMSHIFAYFQFYFSTAKVSNIPIYAHLITMVEKNVSKFLIKKTE